MTLRNIERPIQTWATSHKIPVSTSTILAFMSGDERSTSMAEQVTREEFDDLKKTGRGHRSVSRRRAVMAHSSKS